MTFKAPFLRYSDVGQYANTFLLQYHPSLQLPIPIEKIIEFNLNLRIHPITDMYRTFQQNGFLSRRRTVIYVDEYQYDNFLEKYRFTLSHEVGHYIMHKSLYEGLSFDSEEEFMEWLFSRPRDEVNWLETQANWFAGQLLVPAQPLQKCCIDLLEANRENYSDSEFIPHEFWSNVSNELAEIFEVNPKVVEIQIQKASIIDKFKNYYRNH